MNVMTARRTPTQKKQHAEYMRQYRLDNPQYVESVRERNRQRYRNNPGYYQDVSLKHKFGVGLDLYDEMYARQEGRCGVCGIDKDPNGRRFAIDHDHACCAARKTCGRCVRMLLCSRCNTVLGHVGDDIELLRTMIEYIGKFR